MAWWAIENVNKLRRNLTDRIVHFISIEFTLRLCGYQFSSVKRFPLKLIKDFWCRIEFNVHCHFEYHFNLSPPGICHFAVMSYETSFTVVHQFVKKLNNVLYSSTPIDRLTLLVMFALYWTLFGDSLLLHFVFIFYRNVIYHYFRYWADQNSKIEAMRATLLKLVYARLTRCFVTLLK